MKLFFLFFFLSFNIFASTLHLAASSNPARINPLLATDSASGEIASHIFNSLVKFDKDSSTIVGDLARKFYFENNTTLVFELRDDVLWQDGEKFSAKDVLFTYKTLLSKDLISPYSSDFRFVKSVEIIDRYKLRVHYKKPYFKALEIWMMGILPEHILKNENSIMNAKFNTHPIGTGPYKLTQLEYSKDIILSRNKAYFEGAPKIDRIVYHIIADPTTRFLMLKSQQLDVGSLDAISYERKLDKEFFHHFNIYERVSRSYTYLGFNLRKKKFKDAKVREALSLAISRKELVDILFFKHAKVCSGPFLPTSSAFNKDVKVPTQNLNKAKKLLKEAGYDDQHPLKFEIATSNSNAIRPYAAQIIQYQLKKIGVVVKLKVMEWQAFLNTVVFPHKFDTILLGWGLSPTPDPYAFWHSDNDKMGGFNLVGYHNKKVDKLIEESQVLVDKKKLDKKFREIFKLVVADNPYLFLYIPNAITAINKKIKGVTQSPSGIWHNYIRWDKPLTTYK
jgi:peptide/nickel transport system substrate-binding protein